MRKVIKILLSVFSYLLLTAIVVPIFASILLFFPVVQNFLADRAASWASAKLNTTVRIDNIYLRPFNRLDLNGVFVADLQGDTLLYVKHLSVTVNNLGLFSGGRIALGSVTLKTGQFFLHEVTPGTMNITQLIDPLTAGSKKSSGGGMFALDAALFHVEGVRYRMVLDSTNRSSLGPGAINFSNLDVRDVVLDGTDLSVRNDSVSMSNVGLSFNEKCGFTVNRLNSDHFSVSKTGLLLGRMSILTPLSDMHFSDFRMVYPAWIAYRDFIRKVSFEAQTLPSSRFDFHTIACFAPPLQSWNIPLTGIVCSVKGPVADMGGFLERAVSGNTVIRNVRFDMKGIPQIYSTNFLFDIGSIESNAPDIRRIVGSITGRQPVPDNLLNNFSPYRLGGRFTGTLRNFNANAALTTSHGNAQVDVRIAPARNAISVTGSLEAQRLDLGLASGNKNLGSVSISATGGGVVGRGNTRLRTDANLRDFQFKGYTYNAIALNGSFDNNIYTGRINCVDPNLDFGAEGMFDLLDTLPRYNARIDLRHADLVQLRLNNRDSVSVLSCQLKADASGRGLDDLNGKLVLDSVRYVNATDTLHTGLVTLNSENSPELKHLSLTSDFADAEYFSRKSYAELGRSFVATIKRYLPTLYPVAHESPPASDVADTTAGRGNTSIVRLEVKEANNVAGILVPGLKIASGTRMRFSYNIATEQFTASLRSDSMAYNHFFASGIDVSARNLSDSMQLAAGAKVFSYGNFDIPNLEIAGNARHNSINAVVNYRDTTSRSSAHLGIRSFVQVGGGGATRVQMELAPSWLATGPRRWDIVARNIYYDTTRVAIDGLSIESRGEGIKVDGVLSRSREDTLKVRMNNLDLRPLSHFTQPTGFTVAGLASGRADIVSGLRGALLYANLGLDSLGINNIDIPSLTVDTRWDTRGERARGSITDRERGDTLAVAYYHPVDQSYHGRVNVNNVDLSLIDPFLKGVLRGTSGKADVALSLEGQADRPVIGGAIAVRNMATTIDFTNVAYTVPTATISVSNDNFTLQPTPIIDPEGNRGTLDIDFRTIYLSNINYQITVRPENMMVINTGANDNQLFFGTVFATGLGVIRGDRAGVRMDINATTAGNSIFTLSPDNRSDFGQADFVTFRQRIPLQTAAKKTVSFHEPVVKRTTRSNGGGGLEINMALAVRPNVEMRILLDPASPDGISARGNGNVNIRVNPALNDFSIYGDFVISEGTYVFNLQNIVRRRFTIDNGGTLTFTGDPMNTLLDITAIYNTKASIAPLMSGSESESFNRNIPVACKIHLTERISQPNIAFDIDLPNADPEVRSIVANAFNTQEAMATQFVWLLAANTFYTDTGAGSNNVGTGLGGAGASIGINAMLRAATNFINPSGRFNFGATYRPGGVTSSDELEIGLVVPISDRWQIEADGSVPLNTNSIGSGTSNNNLAGDFYVTYRISRSGNLKAKVFTRTITRFDENQGQQENGLGIYYYDDFNKFSDLFKRRRYRSDRIRPPATTPPEVAPATPD